MPLGGTIREPPIRWKPTGISQDSVSSGHVYLLFRWKFSVRKRYGYLDFSNFTSLLVDGWWIILIRRETSVILPEIQTKRLLKRSGGPRKTFRIYFVYIRITGGGVVSSAVDGRGSGGRSGAKVGTARARALGRVVGGGPLKWPGARRAPNTPTPKAGRCRHRSGHSGGSPISVSVYTASVRFRVHGKTILPPAVLLVSSRTRDQIYDGTGPHPVRHTAEPTTRRRFPIRHQKNQQQPNHASRVVRLVAVGRPVVRVLGRRQTGQEQQTGWALPLPSVPRAGLERILNVTVVHPQVFGHSISDIFPDTLGGVRIPNPTRRVRNDKNEKKKNRSDRNSSPQTCTPGGYVHNRNNFPSKTTRPPPYNTMKHVKLDFTNGSRSVFSFRNLFRPKYYVSILLKRFCVVFDTTKHIRNRSSFKLAGQKRGKSTM